MTVYVEDPAAMWQATLQARELRQRYGLSYNAIAGVIEHYHGVSLSAHQWGYRLRKSGCDRCPRGRMHGGVSGV